jgi:predicted nucleic-acid-binding Zn-ribbon protein
LLIELDMQPPSHIKNRIGERYGKRVITGYVRANERGRNNDHVWEITCECGDVAEVTFSCIKESKQCMACRLNRYEVGDEVVPGVIVSKILGAKYGNNSQGVFYEVQCTSCGYAVAMRKAETKRRWKRCPKCNGIKVGDAFGTLYKVVAIDQEAITLECKHCGTTKVRELILHKLKSLKATKRCKVCRESAGETYEAKRIAKSIAYQERVAKNKAAAAKEAARRAVAAKLRAEKAVKIGDIVGDLKVLDVYKSGSDPHKFYSVECMRCGYKWSGRRHIFNRCDGGGCGQCYRKFWYNGKLWEVGELAEHIGVTRCRLSDARVKFETIDEAVESFKYDIGGRMMFVKDIVRVFRISNRRFYALLSYGYTPLEAVTAPRKKQGVKTKDMLEALRKRSK